MYNLCVKLSAMSEPYASLSPQVFLDCSSEESLSLYKAVLPQPAKNVLEFAFTDKAILLILENEFEVQVAHRQMVFSKPMLNTQSLLFAHGYSQCPKLANVTLAIDELTEALWIKTAVLSPRDATLDDRLELRRELKTLFTLHYCKYARHDAHVLESLRTPRGMQQFLYLVVADALYKADAARVLFGSAAPYTLLWLEKQQQYYDYALHLEKPDLRVTA